jgi:aldose 1-epimerase
MIPAVRLAKGAVEAEVLPTLGARLHRLRVFGRDLLRTPPDIAEHTREPFFWGGYHMAPWCNRIAAQALTVAGRVVDPPANFRDGTAIHGRVQSAPADPVGGGRFRVEDGGDQGWPWRFTFEVEYSIGERQLAVHQTLVNGATSPMPAGIGFHPWFSRPVEVAINAAGFFATNIDSPAQPRPVAGDFDRRRPGVLAPGIDATWTDVAEPPIELAWPAHEIAATVRFSAPSRFVTAAAPTDLDGTAVEPQTHAPDGLRRLSNGEPGGLALLEPGARLEMSIQFEFRREGQEEST